MAFARNALVALVRDAGGLEPDQRNHPAQIQVYFTEFRQFLQGTAGNQAIIRVIKHNLRAHCAEQLVEAFRREALEERVGITLGAHAVDDFAAVKVRIHHRVHGVDIVLPVAVDADGDVAAVFRLHQPCPDRPLVPSVAALRNALEARVFRGQRRDNLPRLVLAAVVDEQNAALVADFPRVCELTHLVAEHAAGNRQYAFFVVAGNHNIQYRLVCHAETPPVWLIMPYYSTFSPA